jgi:hypothetical protein
VVDQLLAAGVPVSALWIYDGMFQATFASPEDTRAALEWITANSWAELEEKMRTSAAARGLLPAVGTA